MPKPPGDVEISGITANKDVDAQEVYKRALAEWDKTSAHYKRAETQTIAFKQKEVALVFVADTHIGSAGVDYRRLFAEAEIIRDTPNMYLCLIGDLIDNFVVGKLAHIRHHTRINIEDEYVLLKKYLDIVAPKLILSVSGNHEKWTWLLSGIDYFRSILDKVAPSVIYDSDDVNIIFKVGKSTMRARLRHKWRGTSLYNVTHGIERAAKFDLGFRLGVGAHTHAAGVTRSFVCDGQTSLAVLCGSYKMVDPYSKSEGFYRPNGSTAVTVIIHEDGSIIGIDRLETAARVMRALNGGKHAKR